PPPRWYIVQCNPGLEDSVKATIMAKVANSRRLQKTVVEVLVPCTKVTKLGLGNKPVEKQEKLFAGYVLVRMRMDKDTWFMIKNSNHVLNFVGHDRARKNAGGGIAAGRGHVVPTPLTRDEERRIFERLGMMETSKVPVAFEVGTRVRVKGGAFSGNEGKVVEIDHNMDLYRIRFDLFKSETPTEFSAEQLER
ncbi:hypothetical protein GUITHDRAFT_60459, partial [Guillardia theta CCMP2712]